MGWYPSDGVAFRFAPPALDMTSSPRATGNGAVSQGGSPKSATREGSLLQALNVILELMSWIDRASSLLNPRGWLAGPGFQRRNPKMIPPWCLYAWSWIMSGGANGPAGHRRGTARFAHSHPLGLRVITSLHCGGMLQVAWASAAHMQPRSGHLQACGKVRWSVNGQALRGRGASRRTNAE